MVTSGHHRRTILAGAFACLVASALYPPDSSATPETGPTLPDGTPLPALRGEIPEEPSTPAAPATGADSSRLPPAPPDIALPVSHQAPKKPLAWRTRVPAAAPSTADPGNRSKSLLLLGSAGDVLAAIGNACRAAGLAVDSLNAEAGEVLLRSSALPQQPAGGLIVSVRDRGAQTASVLVVPETRGGKLDLNAVDALLTETGIILNRRGSL